MLLVLQIAGGIILAILFLISVPFLFIRFSGLIQDTVNQVIKHRKIIISCLVTLSILAILWLGISEPQSQRITQKIIGFIFISLIAIGLVKLKMLHDKRDEEYWKKLEEKYDKIDQEQLEKK